MKEKLYRLYPYRNYLGFGIANIFIIPCMIFVMVNIEKLDPFEAIGIVTICSTVGSVVARIAINEIFK